jgi:hypothetical protein
VRFGSGSGQLRSFNSSSSRLGSSSSSGSRLDVHHTATAAARMAREASLKASHAAAVNGLTPISSSHTAADTADTGLNEVPDLLAAQQQQQDQALLALQAAAASAALASALATARQVLVELVLGASPSPQALAQLDGQLAGLNLDEALSEVVYQVGGPCALSPMPCCCCCCWSVHMTAKAVLETEKHSEFCTVLKLA